MYRKTWLEINLDAIHHNTKTIKEISQKKLIAVLKADAYGCNDTQIIATILDAGADMIAVSSLDEALALRYFGYLGKLLILGVVDTEQYKELIDHNISCAIPNLKWAMQLSSYDLTGLKLHLKVDTGMNRIGFKDVMEAKQALQLLKNAHATVDGIFTHYHSADTSQDKTMEQFETFKTFYQNLNEKFEWIHCDNSAASISFHEDFTNACRVGIFLYGIATDHKDLQGAVALKTKVAMVKQVQSGETIGYGATYTTNSTQSIATIPIGYADGFLRRNQGRKVFVHGTYATIVGRICMDQTMIQVDDCVKEEDEVEIFGSHISIEEMANDLDTISYEIITNISDRVTRVYIQHGKVIKEFNPRFHHE